MQEWLVRLQGDRFDLRYLADYLRYTDLSVIEEGGFHYLKAPEFDSLATAKDVHASAEGLLEKINTVARFSFPDFRSVGLRSVTEVGADGKHRTYAFGSAHFRVRSRMRVKAIAIKSDGTMAGSEQPNLAPLLALALLDRNVAKALRFFVKGDWFGLYKVYEIVGKKRRIVKKGWVTEQTIIRFTQTAQSQAAVGDEARHADDRFAPPAVPMPISEARSLIRGLLANWLKWLQEKSPKP